MIKMALAEQIERAVGRVDGVRGAGGFDSRASARARVTGRHTYEFVRNPFVKRGRYDTKTSHGRVPRQPIPKWPPNLRKVQGIKTALV